MGLRGVLIVLGVLFVTSSCGDDGSGADVSDSDDASPSAEFGFVEVPTDFSGMAWLGADTTGDTTVHTFLTVQDAKNDGDEAGQPRVSLIRTPTDSDGLGGSR